MNTREEASKILEKTLASMIDTRAFSVEADGTLKSDGGFELRANFVDKSAYEQALV